LIIVADQHIPFIADIFSELGELRLIPGQEIGPETVKNADVLIVRSITAVNEALLSGSSITYVGSATAGLDHVDRSFLDKAGIRLGNAPGANATSVVEYVLAALSEFGHRTGESFTDRSIGIIGAGHVGGLLASRCRAFGMKTWVNDPPLQSSTGSTDFSSIEDVFHQSDIISIHTPLTTTGDFPTQGLIDARMLATARRNPWFIHSARGGVCLESALLEARRSGQISQLALDVWENEPTPSLNTIESADLATGHIAGYSLDAKIAGVKMLKMDVCDHFGRTPPHTTVQAEQMPSVVTCDANTSLVALIGSLYPIIQDDHRFRTTMRSAIDYAAAFHSYRATYPVRRTFPRIPVLGTIPESWKTGLGLDG